MKHTVKEVKLSGGAKGLLIDVPGSEAVGMELWFNSGFRHGDYQKFEKPHITEHLLVGANKQYPNSIEFKKEIEKNGGGFNAFTNSFFNGYQWWCADFDVKRITSLAVPQLTQPLISDKDVRTEQSRVREELEGARSDHDRAADDNLDHSFYGIPDLKMRLSQLKSITASDMRQYYKTTHNAKNARFYAAGNLNPTNQALVLSGFERILRGLPSGEWLSPQVLSVNTLDASVIEKREIDQIYYHLHFQSHLLDPRQWAAASVLVTLFRSFLPSSLYAQVYEKGLAYHISSGFSFDPTESGLAIHWSVSPQNIKRLFKTIVNSLRYVIDGKVGEPELEAVRQIIRGQTKLRYQTPGSILGFYAEDYMLFDQLISIEDWTKMQLAVSKKQLAKAAADLLADKKWALSFVGPIEAGLATELYSEVSKLW